MEEVFNNPTAYISIFIAVNLLILLLVLYFLKERKENRELNRMQQSQGAPPMDQSMAEMTSPEMPPVEITTKRKKKLIKAPFSLGKPKILTNLPDKAYQMKMTASMISQLRDINSGGWFVKNILQKFIPEEQLNDLMEKALKGELEESMTVKIEDGRITITKDEPTP